MLKQGKEGAYQNEGHGARPYENFERVSEADCLHAQAFLRVSLQGEIRAKWLWRGAGRQYTEPNMWPMSVLETERGQVHVWTACAWKMVLLSIQLKNTRHKCDMSQQ